MKKKLFILFQHWVPQHFISRCVGRIAQSRRPLIKNTFIKWFIKRYDVNMAEALEENPKAYPHFNDFFTRALKPGARVIDAQANSIVSPADGEISQLGDISLGRVFQAKGHHYGLIHLLGGNAEDAKPFLDGKFMTVYLSPKDYHRVHMPVKGTLKKMIYVPGKLFSVNQATAASVPELFAKNERVVVLFETEHGPLAMILVGAMIVASIETTWAGTIAPFNPGIKTTDYNHYLTPITIEKGAEMGRFKLGSTVIMLFGKDAMNWSQELEACSGLRMGQQIGSVL